MFAKKSMYSKIACAIAVSSMAFASSQIYAKERVGVAFYRYDDNFMSTVRRAMQRNAKDFQEVDLLLNDSQNNQATQNEQVDVLLQRGVKVLAINLVDIAAATTVISKAKEKDVPVIFFNRDPGQKILSTYSKAYFVGTAPEESGRIQADLIAKHWDLHKDWDLNKDKKIQFVLLKGEPGHPDAEARTKYVIEQLHEKGYQTQQLLLDTAFWDTAQAKDKMDAWLSGPYKDLIEVVITNNDAMALGAIESLRAAGRKIPVFGVDALPEALQKVKSGELRGTVLNDGPAQAVAILEMSRNLVQGKDPFENSSFKIENKNTIRVPYVGVDSSNLEEFLNK